MRGHSNVSSESPPRTKAERRGDRQRAGRYYEEQLTLLQNRVRDGFTRFDAGELDALDIDELIHRYKRAARELWKFCGEATGDHATRVARAIGELESRGETIDWWERGNPPRERG